MKINKSFPECNVGKLKIKEFYPVKCNATLGKRVNSKFEKEEDKIATMP